MDEYERLVLPFIGRGERIADRRLPFRAGIGGNPVLRQRADCRHDVTIRHEHAARNGRMRDEGLEAPLQHRFAAELFALLWQVETGTPSPSAGAQDHRGPRGGGRGGLASSEEHTSEVQSLTRNSYAVF